VKATWTRRGFLGALAGVGAAALVGCGDDDSPDSGGASPSDEFGGSSTDPAGGSFPRDVAHEVGTTTIGAKPARIVAVTDGAELAGLLALGVRPVGFGQRNDPLEPWIAEALGDGAGTETYALESDPNFEVMASWRPDVIVGQYGFVTEETISQFQAVAPTVSTSFIDWRTSLRQVAQAIGADADAERVITELEAEITASKERLAGKGKQMRWFFGFPDYYGQFNDQSPIGKLLTELGLPTLPAQIAPGEAVDQVLPENLGAALDGAEALVIVDFEDPEGDGDAELMKQPLFADAEVVTAGKVLEIGVDDSNGAYFDSALTIRRNLALIERVLDHFA
jgi:iron complex transport system substrate-binding protein